MSIQTQNYPNRIIFKKFPIDLFYPLRRWVDNIEVSN
jgi:hypothetical protein